MASLGHIATNRNNTVVGITSGGGFIWKNAYGLYKLNSLLVNSTDWSITNAFDINDGGAIAASASFSGGPARPVLLRPVPGSSSAERKLLGERVESRTQCLSRRAGGQ